MINEGRMPGLGSPLLFVIGGIISDFEQAAFLKILWNAMSETAGAVKIRRSSTRRLNP